VIFYVASKSGEHAIHNIRGERFQGISGSDLYRMEAKDYRERDAKYGDLLYNCIQELLLKSEHWSNNYLDL